MSDITARDVNAASNEPAFIRMMREHGLDGIVLIPRAQYEALMGAKDQAYSERNHVVAALARLFPSGIRPTNIEGWEPDWHGCVYIDLPTGQISYHYHDSEAHLFEYLPWYQAPYDGHDKETVHKRLAALRSAGIEETR